MFYLKQGEVAIRKFNSDDIENKILWINNPENNKFLHYEIPLEYDKTVAWFQNIKDLQTRIDAVIEYNGIPVGLIGLLNIDDKNKKAEYYVCMGEKAYKGKGIAYRASKILLQFAFEKLQLNKVYLYTEVENIGAQKLFEKLLFKKEGVLKCDLIHNGRIIDRIAYGLINEGISIEF